MNKAKRPAVIAGNWKMNKNRAEAAALITELLPLVKDAGCEVVLCTPYTDLETALALTEGTGVKIGADNCHWAESGAFTGEISAEMLRELGVQYVIIGHSERRQYFGETDETVAKRLRAALNAGLKGILCVGETLEQREAGITEEVIAIGRALGLPERFLIKPPSDGLTGKTDEDNLGFSYHAVNEYVRKGVADPAIKEQIDHKHRVSRFKFQTIPVYHNGLPIVIEDGTDFYK